jgi:hypothetical protein
MVLNYIPERRREQMPGEAGVPEFGLMADRYQLFQLDIREWAKTLLIIGFLGSVWLVVTQV